ncbi:MAG: aldehyde dehydrogenase family protein, partial [Myxococcales bacterium]|nr:aldehyde dehydrogenase family protein [Myxococcales bacterium]
MSRDVQNYIDGKWEPAAAGRTSKNFNPATGEVIGTFPLSDEGDVNRAVAAAVAQREAWGHTPPPARANILFEAWRLMLERVDELAEALTREEGKVIGEARGEILKAAKLMEFIAGEGRRMKGETVPS